jgi:hypothetical protein
MLCLYLGIHYNIFIYQGDYTMKSIRFSLLALAFAMMAGNPGSADAQVTVNIDLNHALMQSKITEIRNSPITAAHVSAIREQIMKEQALARPLELNVIDPILRTALMNPIRTQIMESFRGRMAGSPGNPSIEPLGALPGLIAPAYP